MPELRISCLGTLRVELGGNPLTSFDTDKTRALLAYLAVRADRPHHREHLAGLLWSDQSDERALHSLRQTLSLLRKALGEETSAQFLITNRDTIQWNQASSCWLDTNAFVELLATSCRNYRRQGGCGRLDIRSLCQALDLYQGPFLDQLYLNGSDLFEEWASLQREEYNQRAVEGFARLAEYHELRGEYLQARQAAQRIVELAPWEETAQGEVMRLLAVDGQWSAALNQYATLRRYLEEHLGVEPAPATTALFKEIRLAAASRTLMPPRTPPAPRGLPLPATPFVGRDSELAQLSTLLNDPDCRLLALLGPGGIGKTRLAIEAAGQEVGIFAEGVFFVSLAAISTGEQIASAAAEALGLTFSAHGSPQEQLLDYLRGKALLLVLDNFEHLLPDPASTNLLAEILRQAPGVVLLVTSRQRLNLQEEHVYLLQGMAYPPGAAPVPEKPEAFDALALFARRARQVAGSFSLDKTALPDVIRVCQMLDGLPLGVELAAAATLRFTCGEIAARLAPDLPPGQRDGADGLAAAASNVIPRHRSLRAAFDVSWYLLEPGEQQAFCSLSVFRGGFTAEAAGQAAPATPAILEALVNKSLLRRDPAGRYEMHELIRQYAAGRLAETPTAAGETRACHAKYYAGLLERSRAALKGPQQETTLKAIALEKENSRQAWDWLSITGNAAGMASAADSLFHFYNIYSLFGEGIELFQKGLSSLPPQAGDDPAVGMVLSRLGALAVRARQYALAEEALSRSRTILARSGDRSELAFCLVALGGLRQRQAAAEEALACARQGLACYRQVADAWGESDALYLVGFIRHRQGNIAEARPPLSQAAAISRKIGDLRQLVSPLNLLGDIACFEGDLDGGARLFEECLEISRRLNDRFNQAIMLNNLATVYHLQGKIPQEQTALQASLEICRAIGDRDGEAIALNNLGEMSVLVQDFRAALNYSEQALEIATEIQEKRTIAVCHMNMGDAWCGLGELEQAETYLQQALRTVAEIDALDFVVRIAIRLGRVYQKQNRPGPALRLLTASLAHSAADDEARGQARAWLQELGQSSVVNSSDEELGKALRELGIQ